MKTAEINTKCATIIGQELDDCLRFCGIKYATAKRWEYPVVTTNLPSPYDATCFKDCSYQRRAFEPDEKCNAFYHKEFRKGLEFTYNEDCLYLNIWAPKNAVSAPVAIYIHGGSFTGGSSNESHIDGTAMAKNGVIFVSINYRLGPFGFCSHPALEDSEGRCGNFGLYDQVAAIEWIKNNISSFGGDSNKITLIGQSAGAMSVDILLSAPMCKDWFKSAVMMSGGALQRAAARPLTPQKTKKFWDTIISNAGAGNIEELKKTDAKTLFYAWSDACDTDKLSALHTLPVQDGKLLRGNLFNMKNAPDIPCMLGVTQTDMAPIALEMITKKFARAIIKNGTPCYVYNFNRDLPGDNAGAWHSCDLLYAFATLNKNWRPFEKVDYEISNQMVAMLCAFFKNADPNCPQIPDWQSGYKMPMRFCEDTGCAPWDTKKLFKNTFSNNGAEF